MSEVLDACHRLGCACWRRRSVLGATVMMLALAGCSSMNSAPEVEEASFNQSSIANGLYHVQRGDTIYSIAWRTGVDFRQLARLNNLKPPYDLSPGQALRLDSRASMPQGSSSVAAGNGNGRSETHAIALGGGGSDTADSGDDSWLSPDESAIQRNHGSAGSSAAAGNGDTSNVNAGAASAAAGVTAGAAAGSGNAPSGANAAASGGTASAGSSAPATDGGTSGSAGSSTDNSTSGGTAVAGKSSSESGSQRTYTPAKSIHWQWPAEGRIVGTFQDQTNLTPGIDIAGQKGQSVLAAGPGIVVYAGSGVHGYGKLIILKHNDQFLSAYAHNQTLRVKENDVVKAGEEIATMGASDADRTELHFEIRQDGQPKDPMTFLPKR